MQRGVHGVLPDVTHDESAREGFVASLKMNISTDVTGGNKLVYERLAAPAFRKKVGQPPKGRADVRRAMMSQPYYQMSSALKRTTQELMWDSVGTSVERQLPALIDKARRTIQAKKTGG